MKVVLSVLLLSLFSCAKNKLISYPKTYVAHDDMANGNIEASAIKSVDDQSVCFDISIIMKNVSAREAAASNWTIAWVDGNARYHLMDVNQRDPASLPSGSRKKWTNNFKTCAPKDRRDEVKYLILAPKELSYEETEGMQLLWH